MRLITLFCVVAMVVAFGLPAQAAVQNVKVSGDVTLRSIYQASLDLDDADGNTTIGGSGAQGDSEGTSVFMSTVGVNVEADLTDNVSAAIRLVNQRDWDRDAVDTTEVVVDLANITLKEMLYSPLTLIIGRQDVFIGDGFIIGANLQQFPVLTADEFTEIASFDAIRGILDYDPWTVDLLYIKYDEGVITDDQNIDIYGVNIGYVFGQYDAEAEAYGFAKYDRSAADYKEIYTLGVRGSIVPLENLDLRGELALQGGDDREAYAADLSGEYQWVDHVWMPTLGLGYVFLSGEDTPVSGDNEEFDRMGIYGKTYSAIREWQEIYYITDEGATAANVNSSGAKNAQTLIVNGSIQPTDNILLEGKYLYFLLDKEDAQGEEDVGSEFDLELTYDYTEDVSFGLLAAWFFPGDVFTADAGDDTASEVVGTVSLVF